MQNRWTNKLWPALLSAALLLLSAEAVWAAPGGIIKAAAQTPLGKIVFTILGILLAPFIIYYEIKRLLHIRQTKADLRRLAASHPRYHWLKAKDQITAAFQWVWSAWSQQKMEKAAQFTTDWYWRNQQMQLDEWEARGQENVCQLFGIQSINPLFVEHTEENGGNGSRLVVEIKARVTDYLREKATGKIVEGDEKRDELTSVWTFLWQDGAWRLNMIEPSGQVWDYLAMPNVLTVHPQTSQAQ